METFNLIFKTNSKYECLYGIKIIVNEMIANMEKLQQLLACGTGHKTLDDDLFKTVDNSLKIYRREGIFEIEDQLNLNEPEYVFVLRSYKLQTN